MDIQQCNLNFFVATLSSNNFKATDIHQLLINAWGEDNIVGVRRIQAIAKEFAEGRVNFKRSEGSGRPRTSTCLENVERVRELIEENCRLSCPDIESITGIEERSVQRILTKDLNKKSLCCRWIPHVLTEKNKAVRVERAREILRVVDRRLMKEKLVVIDEKWVYFRSVRPKECNRAWVNEAGDRPQLPRQTISNKKVMLIVASNYSKSFSYHEILRDGGTINADRYLQFLHNMFEAFQRQLGLPLWEMTLQHDNAKPHFAIAVREWLTAQRVSLLLQPPYSPDYNLMDRFLFRNFEVFRHNVNFNTSNEVESAIDNFFQSLTAQMMSKQFNELKVHLTNVITANGNYI